MAMIVSDFISPLMKRLLSLIENESALLLGAKGELHKLERKLEAIKDVLEDAERKQLRDRAVRRWLDDLRHFMYDADDLIEDCRVKALQKVNYLCCLIGFRHEIGRRVRKLNARLEEISKERSELQLVPCCQLEVVNPSPVPNRRSTRETSSVFVESDIVGLDEDANRLVEFLTEGSGENSPKIFAITGMGGIGKTTLAQKVFNDNRIDARFEIKMWVCVSQDFTEINLLKQIVRSAGGSCGEAQTRAELDPVIRKVVENKRFFLVLDDVWSGWVWDDLLRSPLHGGAATGSRILVTTRNEQVARQMGAVHCHRMNLMSDEDGWSMLCRIVFGELNEEDVIETFRDIGMGIVGKCHGLPLAIKAIAGVLRMKDMSWGEWEKVRANQIWTFTGFPDGILPALYLSYEDLLPPLKQCFIFCSLFPEDFEIFQWDLIQMWIAEGFVEGEGELELEHVAEEYYWELIGRGLLQALPRYYGAKMCKMHDLVRSLAVSLAKDVEISTQPLDVRLLIRHLSMINEQTTIIPDIVQKQKRLRTLLLFGSRLSGISLKDIFHKFRNLRVLDLCDTGIENLPVSVGKLVHLRLLNLSCTRLKELPESVCYLHNLQTLILEECRQLHRLPRSIVLLNNLRYLSLRDTPINYMPKGIGRLKNLSTFDGFVIGSSDEHEKIGCGMDELKSLPKLRYLRINKLERVSTVAEVIDAAVGDKTNLKCLRLWCSTVADSSQCKEDDIKKMEAVFKEFCPPKCLEELALSSFDGRNFPSWMSGPYLPDLKWLRLLNCSLCKQLPPLHTLPQLRVLLLQTPAVVTIGPEFLGDSTGKFPKLEQLFFRDMSNWKEWQGPQEWVGGVLPCLKRLVLLNCPRLGSLPIGLQQAPILTDLHIKHASSLRKIKNLPSVKNLFVIQMPNLVSILNLPALESLKIISCSALKEVMGLGNLKHLELFDAELGTLPDWLQELGTLQRLYIVGKENLLQRCLENGEDWAKIRHIPHIISRHI